MARRRTTTESGLGWDHQEARRRLPLPNGDACPLCGHAMWPDQALDADHQEPRALGGRGLLRWAHRSCNRRAGAVLGNRLRARGGKTDRWVDRWA